MVAAAVRCLSDLRTWRSVEGFAIGSDGRQQEMERSVDYKEIEKASRAMGYRDKLRLAQLLIQLARRDEEQAHPSGGLGAASGSSDAAAYAAPRLRKLKPATILSGGFSGGDVPVPRRDFGRGEGRDRCRVGASPRHIGGHQWQSLLRRLTFPGGADEVRSDNGARSVLRTVGVWRGWTPRTSWRG